MTDTSSTTITEEQKQRKTSSWYVHLGIAIAGIVAIVLTVQLLSSYGNWTANRWLADIQTQLGKQCYHYSYDTYIVTVEAEDVVGATLSKAKESPELRRLREQCSLVRSLALLHLRIMTYHYVSYYVALTMATLSAVLAGIFLFGITRIGWQDADSHIITIFLIMAGSALFFSQLPSLFEHEKNIAHNTTQYASYIELEHRIMRYMVNGKESSTDAEGKEVIVSTAQFVRSVDQQLSDMNKLLLMFNTGAIPRYTEFPVQVGDPNTIPGPTVGN